MAKTLADFRKSFDPMYRVSTTHPVFKRGIPKSARRFIITAAQNATPVHADFVKSLLVACDHLNAELLVVPLRYKNPTSHWSGSQQNAEHWAEEIRPYLWSRRWPINENLVLLGDVKTQPTAKRPLEGFETITHAESGILAHTKLQLRVIPAPQSRYPKIMTTTGACTLRNYTDSAAGKKGEFHHCLGAALVEVRGKTFHLRQINAAADGTFIDKDKLYTPARSVKNAPRALGLAMGDTHRDFIAPGVERATFESGGMVEVLHPEWLIWHDLDDNYGVNHHHGDNPFNALVKRETGRHRPLDELKRAIEYVQRRTPADTKSAIVYSNHNRFLRDWILEANWKSFADKNNMLFYLETAAEMVKGARLGEIGLDYPDPFSLWARKLLPENDQFKVLDRDESFMLGEIECGGHGDDGPNGARGTLQNLARIGVKVMDAHEHTPGIEEGHTRVGTSTRRKAEYVHGPSSWMNTHGVVYANSKRSLLNIIDGAWCI